MTDLYGFTGSRAFEEHRPGMLWAAGRVAAVLCGADPVVVVHGGAAGLDALVDRVAAALGMPRLVFDYRRGYPHLVGYTPGAAQDRELARVLSSTRRVLYDVSYPSEPLARDRAMVAWIAQRRDAGLTAKFSAFKAPWAASHGTDRTFEMASNAVLSPTWEECPDSLRP